MSMDAYESLAEVTARMLQAAQLEDWDRVVALEQDCRRHAARLAEMAQPPDDAARRRRVELIQRVLAHDAEIRRLASPWMDRLQGLIGTARNERSVLRAYGSDGASG